MVYCPSCGQKLEEDFNFCPKCGTKTKAGATAGVSEPWEAMREAFLTAGEEMRKAFLKAGDEIRRAFEEARKERQSRPTIRKKLVCSNCGAQNPPESKYCSACGKPIS